MKRLSLFWVLIAHLATPAIAEVLNAQIRPPKAMAKTEKMHIRILDQKELRFGRIATIPFAEISDLAYDSAHHRLWMLSDKGYLYRFTLSLDDRIRSLEPVGAWRLRSSDGRRLRKGRRDSEGLTLDGRGRLYVSFEGKPRIARIDGHGRIVRYLRLPRRLKRVRYRSRNKTLESLAWHPRYGLLTALEYPPKGVSKRSQSIYALSGRVWRFEASPFRKDAVTALEVMDDGTLLVLERAFTGWLGPWIVTLRKVWLDRREGGRQKSRVLARFRSDEGWGVDNFEGLTRVGPRRYLMISDDNDNFFEKTLLIYFEVTGGK